MGGTSYDAEMPTDIPDGFIVIRDRTHPGGYRAVDPATITGGGGGGGSGSSLRVVTKTINWNDPNVLTGIVVASLATGEWFDQANSYMSNPLPWTVSGAAIPVGHLWVGADRTTDLISAADLANGDSATIGTMITPQRFGFSVSLAAAEAPVDLIFILDDNAGPPAGDPNATSGQVTFVLPLFHR